MTRFPHDQFAKDYLKELLTPLGDVRFPPRSVWGSPTDRRLVCTNCKTNSQAAGTGVTGAICR